MDDFNGGSKAAKVGVISIIIGIGLVVTGNIKRK